MAMSVDFTNLSVNELQSYIDDLNNAYYSLLASTENKSEAIKTSVKNARRTVDEEINIIKKLMDAKIATTYYFTTGAGHHGGAMDMLRSLDKSTKYI